MCIFAFETHQFEAAGAKVKALLGWTTHICDVWPLHVWTSHVSRDCRMWSFIWECLCRRLKTWPPKTLHQRRNYDWCLHFIIWCWSCKCYQLFPIFFPNRILAFCTGSFTLINELVVIVLLMYAYIYITLHINELKSWFPLYVKDLVGSTELERSINFPRPIIQRFNPGTLEEFVQKTLPFRGSYNVGLVVNRVPCCWDNCHAKCFEATWRSWSFFPWNTHDGLVGGFLGNEFVSLLGFLRDPLMAKKQMAHK